MISNGMWLLDDYMETLKEPSLNVKLHYQLKVFEPTDPNRIDYQYTGISFMNHCKSEITS